MSKEIWEKNLEAMKKWYPSFADMIRDEQYKKDELEVMVESSWDGEKIFRIKKDDRLLYLGGKRNAKEPIETWLNRMGKLHKYASVFLFGVGSGAYLRALVQNTDKEVNVVVYEPSVTIFLTMLEEIDLSEEIENRPIAFIIEGINETEFEPIMNKVLAVENLQFLKEEIHPNYREFYGEELVKYVKLLHRRAESIRVNYNTGVLFSKDIAQNILSNMKYICEGYNTKRLSDAIPNRGPAILVAAGPSLNKNIQELKKAKNKAFILAVDTAMKPLLKAGVVPDAFMTIDPHKLMELVEIEGVEDIPIIAPTCARSALIERQKGKKIFFFDGYVIPYRIYEMNKKPFYDVSMGGSVACSAFSLLYKMGFNNLILVGQDLAYTNNKSHADGTFKEKMPEKDTSHMIMVKGNYEDEVPTLTNLRMYLDWFKMYVEGAKKHANVRVINATEGGAYIDGTELMTLKDAIEELCHEEVDYGAYINQMKSEFTAEERQKAVEYLHTIPEGYEEIIKSARLLKKAYQKLADISKSKNMVKESCLKQLKKIKKLTKQCHKQDGYQLIEITMPSAEYIIRSEFYYEDESLEAEMQETARKGIKYSELLEQCARLLKEMAEDTLLPITLEDNVQEPQK